VNDGGARGALGVIFFTVFLDLVGFGMILPLLPFYAEHFDASPFLIGVLFASYSLAQAVFAPLLGRVSDRLGRRPVLLSSILVNGISYILFAVAASYGWLLLARIMAGTASANYAVAQAYVADVTPRARRARGMGWAGAAFGLGFVVGPAMGGFLALLGHVAVPVGAAALSFANLALAFLLLPESPPLLDPEERESWSEKGLASDKVTQRLLRGLYLLLFLVIFSFSAMEATLALFCQERFDFGAVETSWLFVFVGLVMVSVQGGLVGSLVQRWGENRLVVLGIVLMSAGLFLLPFSYWIPFLAATVGLLALGSGLHNPSLVAMVSHLAHENAQGNALGLSRSMGALARSVGPLWGGWVFQRMGPEWPYWGAGILMALTLLFAIPLLRRIGPRGRGQDEAPEC
jgi:MFS family permease